MVTVSLSSPLGTEGAEDAPEFPSKTKYKTKYPCGHKISIANIYTSYTILLTLQIPMRFLLWNLFRKQYLTSASLWFIQITNLNIFLVFKKLYYKHCLFHIYLLKYYKSTRPKRTDLRQLLIHIVCCKYASFKGFTKGPCNKVGKIEQRKRSTHCENFKEFP